MKVRVTLNVVFDVYGNFNKEEDAMETIYGEIGDHLTPDDLSIEVMIGHYNDDDPDEVQRADDPDELEPTEGEGDK